MANPKVGDIGTVFTLTIQDGGGVAVDISAATTKDVVVKKADGTTVTKAGVFTTDGTDGDLDWTSASGDLDQEGPLRMEAHVITPAGEWRSSVATVIVLRVL